MDRRPVRSHTLPHSHAPHRPHDHKEKPTELQVIGSIVKSSCYIIGMVLLAPALLNRVSKALDSDIKFSLDFYRIAKGG